MSENKYNITLLTNSNSVLDNQNNVALADMNALAASINGPANADVSDKETTSEEGSGITKPDRTLKEGPVVEASSSEPPRDNYLSKASDSIKGLTIDMSSRIGDKLSQIKNSANKAIAKAKEQAKALTSVSTAKVMLGDMFKSQLNKQLKKNGLEDLPTLGSMVTNIFKDGKLSVVGLLGTLNLAAKIAGKFLCPNDYRKKHRGYGDPSCLEGKKLDIFKNMKDKICSSMSRGEFDLMSPMKTVENVIGYDNIVTAVNQRTAAVTYGLKSKISGKMKGLNLGGVFQDPDFSGFDDPVISPGDLVNEVLLGNGDEAVLNVKNHELSKNARKPYLDAIESELSNHLQTSIEYKSLLKARGDIITAPLANVRRSYFNSKYEHHNDYMGRFSIGLINTDLENMSLMGLKPVEVRLIEKLKIYKSNLTQDYDLSTRGYSSGSFNDYDFDSKFPILVPEYIPPIPNDPNDPYRMNDQDIIDYIASLNTDEDTESCRVNDVSVTACVEMGHYAY